MSDKLKTGQTLSIEEVEARFPNRKLVARVGSGEWADELYFLEGLMIYIQKGPFCTHDAVCYRVCGSMDSTEVEAWVERAKSFWVNASREDSEN